MVFRLFLSAQDGWIRLDGVPRPGRWCKEWSSLMEFEKRMTLLSDHTHNLRMLL